MTDMHSASLCSHVVAGWADSGQGGFAALIAGLAAVLSGAGLLALAGLARLWPIFDVASHTAFHAAGAVAGGLLALGLLFWLGRPVSALVALAGVGALTIFVPAFVASSATVDSAELSRPRSPGTYRLVSLNTWHRNRSQDELMAFLEGANADLLVLLEFGPTKRRWFRRLSKTFPYRAGCSDQISCSVEVLSRHPIVNAVTSSRDRGERPPRVIVKFGDALSGLTLFGVHLMRPIDSYYGNFNEVNLVAENVRQVPRGPVIVAGDFNLTGWSANWSMFRRRSGLKHMGRFLPSWPTGPRGVPQLAIDHVFASREINFERVVLGPSVGSDHRPLIVDFRMSN
ncbi:MAG: endonuclease/exonuclease/phosphatase family protein [Hyphomicrobiaceae bacterium]